MPLNDKSQLRGRLPSKMKDFMNRITSSFNLRCSISCYEYVFCVILPFCIKNLKYEDNVKPYKSVCIAKEMSTDTCSSLHGWLASLPVFVSAGLSCTWVRRSRAALSVQVTQTSSCTVCAPFQVSFCFQKAVKDEPFFYHCNVVNLVPVFSQSCKAKCMI